MTRLRSVLAGAGAPWLWALLLVQGCGGSPCEDYCAEAAGCENAEFAAADNCVSQCEAGIDEVEQRQGCGSELEDMLDCAADADDTCNPQECSAEAFEYLACAGFDDDEG